MSRSWGIVLLVVLAAVGVYAHVALDRLRALEPVELATLGMRPFDLPMGHGADIAALPMPAAFKDWYWSREGVERLSGALRESPELRIRVANTLDEASAGDVPLHAARVEELRGLLRRAEAEGVPEIRRVAGGARDPTRDTPRAASRPDTDPPPLPDAVVDALTGEIVDADTPLPGDAPRREAPCPARVGAAPLSRVEFFAGAPSDETQVFPVDVQSRGEVAALFVFRGGGTTVRCTYGADAGAAVIEAPLPARVSCLVEGLDGTPRITCPSPVSAP